MADELLHFLLIYDRDSDELERTETFDDPAEATTAYEKAERDAERSNRRIDVLLVGSDSLETVKITHGNYFTGRARRRVREALTEGLHLAGA